MPLAVSAPPSYSSSSSTSNYSGDDNNNHLVRPAFSGEIMQGGDHDDDTFELEYFDNKLLEELLQMQDNRHF
ncbi:hypothetical protein glysoja_011105 [Glycine soja]|nr:hypothetical protein glysoja_011105 [Glycine soja]